MNLQRLKGQGRLGVVLPVLLTMLWGTPVAAFQFEFDNGVQGSFDSTISYGMSWRVSERDKDIIGTANGGTAYSVNGDDGNLNYDDDETFSRLLKVTSDLDLRYAGRIECEHPLWGGCGADLQPGPLEFGYSQVDHHRRQLCRWNLLHLGQWRCRHDEHYSDCVQGSRLPPRYEQWGVL